jgi:hypothetical protein
MPQLTGSLQPVSLGQGYALRAPGLRGTATLIVPQNAAVRALSRAAADGTAALDAAFAATNVTEVRRIDLALQPTSPADATRALRGTGGQEAFELEVPDLGPDTGQLVLACDEAGVLTWHLPVDDAPAVQTPGQRGAGGVKRFRIPATQPRPSSPDDAGRRSILGIVGRKLLKVLVYPVTDPIVGAISDFFAERWETKQRPYGLRTFTPENRREPGAGTLSSADRDRLCGGRALLFVHGTFSTAHAGFAELPDDAFAALNERYHGRLFAFNHFTLSHDPRRNIEWLLTALPAGRTIEVDVLCHSRGGLVARVLAERPSPFGLDTSRISVRRIAFVAVPNHGTALADPDHMMNMIDRFTTSLNLFPTGPVVETLEALITAVKVVAHGATRGLEGLASMRPNGEFLAELNRGAPLGDGYYAVAVNYKPVEEGLKALIAGTIAESVIDRVFEHVPNDLVVPEPGVYDSNGSAAFPIPDTRLYRVPSSAGIIHTTVFGYPPVGEKLVEWLA